MQIFQVDFIISLSGISEQHGNETHLCHRAGDLI